MADAGKGIIDLDVDDSEVKRKLKGLDRGVGQSGSRVGSSFSHGFLGSVRTGLSGIGRVVAAAGAAAATGLAGAFVAAGGFGLKLAADIEQIEVALGGLLGSGEAATEMLGNLRQFAKETPFDLPGLAESARRLLGVGFAAEEIIPALGTIGDVAATLGAGTTEINGVVRALGQMRGKGKASAEELQQISEQLPGFVAIDAVAKGLGITTAEAFKKMEQGAIPAEAAIDAILVGMKEYPGAAGAMERQSETLLGMFNRLKESVQFALLDSLKPLLPQLKALIPAVSGSLGQLAGLFGSAFADLLPSVTKAIGPLVEALGPVTEALSGGFADVFAGVAEGLTAAAPGITVFAEAFGRLGEVLGPAAAILGELLGEVLTGLAPVLDALVTAVKPLVPILGDALLAALEALRPIWPVFADAIKELSPLITELATALGKELADTFKELVPVLIKNAPAFVDLAESMTELLIAVLPIIGPLAKLIGFISRLQNLAIVVIAHQIGMMADAIGAVTRFDFAGAWGKVTAAITGFARAVGAQIPRVIQFFKDLPGKIVTAVGNLATKLVPQGLALIGGFLAGMVKKLPFLLGFMLALPFVLIGALIKLQLVLVPKAIAFLGGFLTGLARKLPDLITWMIELPGKLTGKLVNLAAKMIPKGIQLLTGFLTGLVRRAPAILSWISHLPGRIIHNIGSLAKTLFNAGKDLIQGLINGAKSINPFNAIKGVAGGVVDGFKSALGIGSPSKVMAAEVGVPIWQGIEHGFTKASRPLTAPTVDRAAIATQLAATPISVGSFSTSGANVTIENVNNYDRVDTDRFLFDLGFKLAS